MNGDRIFVCCEFGVLLAALLGGWDGAMTTLCIFMLSDYITGIVLAGVFKKSPKTTHGALESKAGFEGLFRKAGMLLIVIVAVRLDMLCSLNGVLRTGTIFALVANEALSIMENLGAMGVPLPKVITKAIENLYAQGQKDDDDNNQND